MKTWQQYYKHCKSTFHEESQASVYNLKLMKLTQALVLDEEYYRIIKKLSESIEKDFKESGYATEANAQSVLSILPFIWDLRAK